MAQSDLQFGTPLAGAAAEAAFSPVPAPLVDIDNVTKSFGQKLALKFVSFSIPSGQICGLLGPNGAGKTTLFRLLMGTLKATVGRLTIDWPAVALHMVYNSVVLIQ